MDDGGGWGCAKAQGQHRVGLFGEEQEQGGCSGGTEGRHGGGRTGWLQWRDGREAWWGQVGTSLGLKLEGLSGHGEDLDFAPRVTGSLWKVLRLT